MLSKAKIKLIHSLLLKKNRDESGLFVAEGEKSVLDIAQHLPCDLLVASAEWLAQHPTFTARERVEASASEINAASLLKTPQGVIALFRKPEEDTFSLGDFSLALDGVQDPGNLGTIVRLADWFGIQHIFCSRETADVFNPKTVQATMGAIGRVRVHYVDLQVFLQMQKNKGMPIVGTFLSGENIYRTTLPKRGIVVMGNEGNGISQAVEALCTHKVLIPNFSVLPQKSESLNVAVATAILCSEIRRG